MSPQGWESVRKWAVLKEEQKGERPFSWCDSHAHLYHTFLATLWPVCLWSVFVFPCLCRSDHHTFISVSVRLWKQQTPVYEVSFLMTWRRR
jgi:hypothetical protein